MNTDHITAYCVVSPLLLVIMTTIITILAVVVSLFSSLHAMYYYLKLLCLFVFYYLSLH